MLTTLLSFIVVIGVVIFVHELGHFLAAKSVGIRVETFSLGYPPKMLRKRVGDTEYCLSWIPLGGYVKMAGMIDESSTGETTLTGAPWEFASKRTWQKLWVIWAGVIMNLVLGVILYTGIAAFKGVPVSAPEVSAEPVVGVLNAGWPAEKAGLQAGDRIVRIEGVEIRVWGDLLTQIRSRPEQPTRLVYQRDGVEHEVTLTPERRVERVDGRRQAIGQIGIGPEMGPVEYRRASAGEVLLAGFIGTGNVIAVVASSLWKLVTFQASVRELGGPILIAKLSGESVRLGLAYYIGFIALISINIGCFNLLPIPALDGAHAIIVASEGILRRQLPTRAKLAIQQVGMVLILALVVLIVVNDAQRILHFDWLKRIF
jgi:regulator of sigma E protease